jgi:hypothetical protein
MSNRNTPNLLSGEIKWIKYKILIWRRKTEALEAPLRRRTNMNNKNKVNLG